MVTHDQEEALSIADRVAVMNAGRLIQVASPGIIYREPADAFVARFIGAGAALSGSADRDAVRRGSLRLPASAATVYAKGALVTLFLRPEHVRLASGDGPAPAGAVRVTIRDTTFLGALTRLHLTLDGEDEAMLLADMPGESAGSYAAGRAVWAWWDAGAIV